MFGTLVHARQRRAVRRAVRVDCQVVREKDFRVIATLSINLSPHGMLVVANERALTGEPLFVSFRLPRSNRWVRANATLSRVVHGRRPGDFGQSFGLEFESLGVDLERQLRVILRDYAPPLPQRELRVDYAATIHLALLS